MRRKPIEVLEPHLRTFARPEPHVFAGTAQPLWRRSTIRSTTASSKPLKQLPLVRGDQ
jgi:hypothetical protein